MTLTKFQIGDIVDYRNPAYNTYVRVLIVAENTPDEKFVLQCDDQAFDALYLIHATEGVRNPTKENKIWPFHVWDDGTGAQYTLIATSV